jgi:excisionase family DNA binding protein
MSIPGTRPTQLGLSTAQTARELGVSLSTVRRWADQGHLEAIRTPGGQRRFSRDAIDSFLTSLHQGPPAPPAPPAPPGDLDRPSGD